jgi:hypothetical protein
MRSQTPGVFEIWGKFTYFFCKLVRFVIKNIFPSLLKLVLLEMCDDVLLNVILQCVSA